MIPLTLGGNMADQWLVEWMPFLFACLVGSLALPAIALLQISEKEK